jgi:hypothetical protein
VTGRHTFVEARRNLRRLLDGADHADAVAQFTEDWRRVRIIELNEAVCSAAAELAEQTGAWAQSPSTRGDVEPSELSEAPTSSVRSVDVTFHLRLEGVPSSQR